MTLMYNEWDIRQRVKELEYMKKYWDKTTSYKLYEIEAKISELKQILGE